MTIDPPKPKRKNGENCKPKDKVAKDFQGKRKEVEANAIGRMLPPLFVGKGHCLLGMHLDGILLID